MSLARLPLYSDEASVRVWAIREYGVESFSTLAMFEEVRKSSRFSETRSINLQAEMIKRNFRTIPFGARHLIELLKEIVQEKEVQSAMLIFVNIRF
jgi:hypothetical protein